MMTLHMQQILLNSQIPYVRQFVNKSIIIPVGQSKFDCLRYLENHHNVSCFLEDADDFVSRYAAEYKLNVRFTNRKC